MFKVACFTTVGVLLINGAFAPAAFSQDAACTVSQDGKSFTLQAMDAKGKPLQNIAGGYHLSVQVNGGASGSAAPGAQSPQWIRVLVDTGSNVLAVPAWKIGNFPADPAHDTSGLVISGLQKYDYSSSKNTYYGYVIQAPVTVQDAHGTSFEASDVQVFAITQTCGSHNHCTALTSQSSRQPGMMGVGFQPTPKLKVNVAGGQTQSATHTNVFAQVSGVQTQGWIFSPDGHIVVGLNADSTSSFASWAPMVQASNGSLSPEGCVYVTEPNKPKSRALCGTILVDTGMSTMNMWVNSGESGDQPFCAKAPTPPKPGFNGAHLPVSSKVDIESPRQSLAFHDVFVIGSGGATGKPTDTFCSNVNGQTNPDAGENAHFNTGRMPLQLYSLARNQTCGTYAFHKGSIPVQK